MKRHEKYIDKQNIKESKEEVQVIKNQKPVQMQINADIIPK